MRCQAQWEAFARLPEWREYILPGRSESEFFEEGERQASILSDHYGKRIAVVAEFGCGIGRILRHMEAEEKIGMDCCRDFLGMLPDGITGIHTEGRGIDLPDGHCDFTYSISVFQHIPKAKGTHRQILDEIVRITRGEVFLQVPRAESEHYRETSFVNTYTIDQVRELVAGIPSADIRTGNLAGYGDASTDSDNEYFITVKM